MLLTIAVVYLLVNLTVYGFQEKLIYLPPPYSGETVRVPEKNRISFDLNGETLSGVFQFTDNAKPTLVYFGGNAEDVVFNYFNFKENLDVNFFAINYRGYAGNSGKPTSKSILLDAESLLMEIRERFQIPQNKLVLMGRSLGSGVASQLITNPDVAAIILITPFDSLLSLAKKMMPLLPVSLLLKHHLDTVKQAKDAKIPLLVIVAEHDQVVPYESSKKVFDQWQHHDKKFVLIKNSDHNSLHNNVDYYYAVNEFLARIPR
ncbi:hypothetical protein MNBD_GAMMA16-534 [hydrothermal vent metagenome]|uniref:Serine aminopeptidase S33 domain-containing protein n=1 Tax=hydrothermal vent metagenome TaxID=652676 RepID=A0A3B0ZEA4_9ZZZZ